MSDKISWSQTLYNGNLINYTYPDIECGNLLAFLRQVNVQKDICLIDVLNWATPYPSLNYDIYIICNLGEFANEEYLNKLDKDPNFKNKKVILITSLWWKNNKFENIKVFQLEHLHTLVRFYQPMEFKKIANRTYTHGVLSRRTAFHKSYTILNLLEKFPGDLQHTFCNEPEHEYTLETLDQSLDIFYPGLKLTHTQLSILKHLHTNPTRVPGEQWDVDNKIYTDSKLLWTPESIFLSREHAPTAYLTEKTFKSIISNTPFVIIGQRYSYDRLKSLGFYTYQEELGIEFDHANDFNRFTKIVELMNNFNFPEFLSSKRAQELADYNQNYFFNQFVSTVNRYNKENIEHILDYINEA